MPGNLKLGSLGRNVFAEGVPEELSEDDNRAYTLVQGLALLISSGVLYAAIRLSIQGGKVFLGLEKDPYERDVWLGVGVGIALALCGAVIAYMGGYERRWDALRIVATALLFAHLAVPAAWGVLWLIRHGFFSF